MASPAASALPKPANWQDLERKVFDVVSRRWRDPDAHTVGRPGQGQDGVDIWGRADYLDGGICGVQVKLTELLRTGDIVDIVSKAENFRPRLRKLIIATTAVPDAKLQKTVRALSAEREAQGRFAVEIMYWEEISQDLCVPDLLAKHYPGWPGLSTTATNPPARTERPYYTQIDLRTEGGRFVLKAPPLRKEKAMAPVGAFLAPVMGVFLIFQWSSFGGWALFLSIALAIAMPLLSLAILLVGLSNTILVLDPRGGWLAREFYGRLWKHRRLVPCQVRAYCDVRAVQKDRALPELVYFVALQHGTKTHELLHRFSPVEQKWVADEINLWAEQEGPSCQYGDSDHSGLLSPTHQVAG